MPTPAPTAAISGVIAAIGLGVAGYRWAQSFRHEESSRLAFGHRGCGQLLKRDSGVG